MEGFNRLSFGLGVAHFDPPLPEVLGDLDELEAHDRFRFANRLQAWVEVQDGRVVDAGQRGGGRINVTKVGYGSASIAFTPIALPDVIDAKPRIRRLPAGRTLVEQGEPGEELFLLFDGVLRVEIDGS